MGTRNEKALVFADLSAFLQKVRARTPARILMGRAGASYRTSAQLDLREAHAAARDAVHAEVDLLNAFGQALIGDYRLFEIETRASGKEQYLLRPDLGRHLSDASRSKMQQCCSRDNDLQIVIGDGLSAPAICRQVPALLPRIRAGAQARGWSFGRPFLVRRCRVGILNEIGELLDPRVAVLLIGERPGLATAESLSAYMAYRPRDGHSDANRNLISNIHARGLSSDEAAARILDLAGRMMEARASGWRLGSGRLELS